MADVWNAYNFLNDSLELGLKPEQLRVVEATFLKQWMSKTGYPEKMAANAKAEDWEFFLHIVPTKKCRE